MTKDKQIEEMANDIWYASDVLLIDDATDVAKALYDNKGYRKSTDVAREIFEEIESARVELVTDALQCVRTYKSPAADPFRALCEGKLTGFEEMRRVLAELKKKYTEGEG